tara:strand:- start:8920 stop:9594 length:675 start_codon:yes stop_codon:yes gene_type:complete
MTALAMKQQGIRPATKVVLYWIADHHNSETGDCFPSINRLAILCEMSRRSVETQITALEDLGLLKRKAQYRDTGGKTANSYLLELTGTLENSDDTQNLRMGSVKSAHGDTQNLRMNNLVRRNLGNKTNNIDQNEKNFDKFWTTYPRKIGKAAAKQSFFTALQKTNADKIIKGARDFGNSMQNQEKQFIPHPRTWLRQKRWEDKIEIPEMNGMKKALEELGLNYD